MTTAMTNAKKQAILDIREELQKQGKRFISFIESLDDVMEGICNKEEEKRKPHSSYCINMWTIKHKGNE
jgi:DNA-binding transcriptional regulator WhiA